MLRCFWETDHNIKISRTIFLGLRWFWETQPWILPSIFRHPCLDWL